MAQNESDPFKETRWSLVLRVQDGDSGAAKAALNVLFEIYWYPIYAYIRRRGNNPEEAEDLTQGYFESLFERDYLKRADPIKGKLREFLLADVKFFLSSEWRKNTAQKRGGGANHVPIDQGWAEEQYQHEPVEMTTPETLFERRWAMTVLDRVMGKLRKHYEGRGSGDLFGAISGFLTWNAGGDSYAEVAERLGVSVGSIKTSVNRMRKRYRGLLEAEVADTVSDPSEVEAEIRHMAASLV